MPRTLQQVVGVERRTKQRYNDYGKHARQRLTQALVTGQVKEYRPDAEESTLANSEKGSITTQVVQSFVMPELANLRRYAEEAFDVVGTKDATNMSAKADLVVDNRILVPDVGISHLLWMEDALNELHGFLQNLPVLSTAKAWKEDDTRNDLWKSDPEVVPRTAKKTVALLLHPGNDKHPPQAIPNIEDVRTGLVYTTVLSGAIKEDKRRQLADNCDKLIRAVRDAIARANQTEAVEVTNEGAAIMGYILG